MGMVYEAQHLRLPRRFAVKVLGKPKDDGLASTALPRFRREAEIASTLQHPHIIETFDFQVSEGGSPYLVMELLDGEDLNERLKRVGRIPASAAIRIIEEIAQALDCAHDKGVVHRDLKPANIYLSKRAGRDDFVKVLDFGVSKLIDAATLTQEKAMVGTPLYMSPEQAVGTQELTAESDVFSLGAIAYEMLTGRRAFAASSIPSILFQIVHGPTPKVSGKVVGIGPEVDEVFARVLAKRKQERFARSSEFSLALAQAFARPVERSWDSSPSLLPTPLPGRLPQDDRSSRIATGLTVGGSVTDIDPSTRAEEAMALAAPLAEPLELAPAELAQAFDAPGSRTGDLLPRRRGGLFWTLAALVAAAGAGAWWFAAAPQKSAIAPPPSRQTIAPPIVPARAVARPVEPVKIAPKPIVFQPDEVAPPSETPHPDVQFSFHIWPRGAEVTVDGKRVKKTVTLPWQERPRRVRIEAPGYRGFVVDAPSTDDRTFEVRLDRVPKPVVVKKTRPQKPLHDAAPVQDL